MSRRLTDEQAEVDRKLTLDFPYFAKRCLKIKPLVGDFVPLDLNRAQRYVCERALKQVERTGRVRRLLVKARQQGLSTLSTARSYWRANRYKNYNIFILAHRDDATKNLFNMVKRYHANMPEGAKPATVRENTQALEFDIMGSAYSLGTAGSGEVGRSGTIQFFIGSEAAFWPNSDDILAGALQAVPDLDGTEVWIESTGNGPNGKFFEMVMAAAAGKSVFELDFIPWFWEPRYAQPEPPGETSVELTDEEVALQNLYALSKQQLYWRRGKIVDLGELRFKREFPSYLMEAFLTTGSTLISGEDIQRAFNSGLRVKRGPIAVGVDPSGGGDAIVFAFRRGSEFLPYMEMDFDSKEDIEMTIAGKILRLSKANPDIAWFAVDVTGGYGRGAAARCRELGLNNVYGVNFSRQAKDHEAYANIRAEMWITMQREFSGENGQIGVSETSSERQTKVMSELMSIGPPNQTSRGALRLPLKSELKSSPNIADAMALTYYLPLHTQEQLDIMGGSKITRKSGGGLTTPGRFGQTRDVKAPMRYSDYQIRRKS